MPITQDNRVPLGNLSLNNANYAKKDEFYTQLVDIEEELKHYTDFFADKVVFCNCDDPFESNFFRYFVEHFNILGLKKLIATCYSESNLAHAQGQVKTPYKAIITSVPTSFKPGCDIERSSRILFGYEGNTLQQLAGDGDFRSDECVELLGEADVVVTNPPFSLFREYIAQLVAHNKKFIVIGNINAVTYKEIIPLILDGKLWLGPSIHSGDRKFFVPDNYPLDAGNCGTDADGRRYICVKGVRWFTNVDYGGRHLEIDLAGQYVKDQYPKYDNYDAIEVKNVASIPGDYDGLMGVPITFLDKYSPDQFEVISLANGNSRTTMPKEVLERVGYVATLGDKGGVCLINGQRKYARWIIQRR